MHLKYCINKCEALKTGVSITRGFHVALQSGSYWAAVFNDFQGDNA